jgi:hypothetical protein
MRNGYVIDAGAEYYCGEECLHKHYTPAEWEELYGDGETDSYWTEWDDDDTIEPTDPTDPERLRRYLLGE